MRRNYTTGFVVITAALLILACILFAVTQGGQNPAPQRSARQPGRHIKAARTTG